VAHRDRSAPLLWFYELDRLIRQEQEALDWPAFLSLALDAGVAPLLSETLGALRAAFATPIPGLTRERLACASHRPGGERLARLVGGASGVDGKESLAILFTLMGFRAKLRYALALTFPAPEFMRTEYGCTHAGGLVLAYLRRFCYLARESAKGVVRLLF
jgi:hypothetical protein